MADGFNLADVLRGVSGLDTMDADRPGGRSLQGREQICYIDIELIDGDPLNFYELSEIDALAANIELIGLQQPLRVRDNPDAEGRYMIVSGHRRRAAIMKLVEDGREDLRQVACICEAEASSPALQELRMLYANADTRRMTAADISKQAVRVEALLYQLKEEGFEFPGRMRDHVAEACKVSKTKLARLKVIRDKLIPEWTKAFEQESMSESVAYEMAQLPVDYQKEIFNYWRDNNKEIKHLYIDNVKTYRERFEQLDRQVCSDGSACDNKAVKRKRALGLDRYYFFSCGTKCCKDCSELVSCKMACPKLADKVKQLKEQRKEAQRNEKQVQEQREKPVIEQIKDLWHRFGVARNAADKTVREFKDHLRHHYFGDAEQTYVEKECLEAKFTTQTELPYGYDIRLTGLNILVRTAQLFGCSTDYLLGVSDQLKTGEADSSPTAQNDTAPPSVMWYSREVEPPVGVKIVVVTGEGWAENNRYAGGGYLDDEGVTQWKEVKAWTFMPDDTVQGGPSGTTVPTKGCWMPGTVEPEEQVDAVADFDVGDGKILRKLAHWNGRFWVFPNGDIRIEAVCVRWMEIPG